MTTVFKSRPTALFLGDILSFICALWITLFLRSFDVPSMQVFVEHLIPFSFLFILWVIVFIIAGLYESRSIILARRALSATLLVAQSINIAFAALFFFFTSSFGVTPKTVLLIYLAVSFLVILLWRVVLFPRLGIQKVENTIVVGSGHEVEELVSALAVAPRAPTRVAQVIDPGTPSVAQVVRNAIEENNARFVIADFTDERISAAFPQLYNFLSQGIRFFDALTVYEQIFGRVPLSQIDESWLARNVSRYSNTLYDPVKRLMDIVGGLFFGTLSLVFYPFIMLAIKLDDGGPVFIVQDRVGEDNTLVRIRKFRSMSGNDNGAYGASGTTKLVVTRVGNVLRKTRLDEIPQLWGVVRGNLSLIGPRVELPGLVAQYEQLIPYYGVRHLIKPGISGWAQLYYHGDPHHATDVEATKMKLSYDLYYLKNRSLMLDVLIALKTIRRVLSRSNA